MWKSIKSWRIMGVVTCTSDDDEVSFDFDVEMSWENLTSGSCFE